VDQAILEAKPVDERLERRAGRAQRLRHVDLAGAAGVEIVGRGDARKHLAGRIVHREDGDRYVGPEPAGAFARQLLEARLQGRVDGEAVEAAVGRGCDRGIGRVRREHRHRLATVGHRLLPCPRDLVGGHHARAKNALQHALARVSRGGA